MKKKTAAETEPQQPDNAVPTGSSLSEDGKNGVTSTEPNGKPTVSDDKGSELSRIAQGKTAKVIHIVSTMKIQLKSTEM